LYSNYRSYIFVVLLACACADALSTTLHVREFSTDSDSSVFRVLPADICWRRKKYVPFPASLQMDKSIETFTYYFMAVKAFSLKVSVMRP
jgi:hypothetical protein